MTEEIKLINEIEAFCKRHADMPESTFGRKVLNNPNFVDDVRKGRSPTFKTARTIRTWMKNQDIQLRRKTNEKDARKNL